MAPFEQWTAVLQSSKPITPKLWLPKFPFGSRTGHSDVPACSLSNKHNSFLNCALHIDLTTLLQPHCLWSYRSSNVLVCSPQGANTTWVPPSSPTHFWPSVATVSLPYRSSRRVASCLVTLLDSIPTLFCYLSYDPSRHWSESQGTTQLLLLRPRLAGVYPTGTAIIMPVYKKSNTHTAHACTHNPLIILMKLKVLEGTPGRGLMAIQIPESRSSAPIYTIKNTHSHT